MSPPIRAGVALLLTTLTAHAQVTPDDALVHFDFTRGRTNLSEPGGDVELAHGLSINSEGRLEFTTALQSAQLDRAGMRRVSERLREVSALSVGGWFFCRHVGEQVLFGRSELESAPLGERLFRPSEHHVNFCLGTDAHGFLMGTINGNGAMPFPHVTISDVSILTWQQLVVVKDPGGHHHFYRNGALVHDDRQAFSSPSRQPWRETGAGAGVPIYLRMPGGGLVGEAWIVPRALAPDEIVADYTAKRARYQPAPPARAVALRDVHPQPPADGRTFDRDRVRKAVLELLGAFPASAPPLDPQTVGEEDCGDYVRRKVSLQVQPGDGMPAYLLIPKTVLEANAARVPAVICFYGTTGGAGKLTTAGLSGRRPGDPSHPNLSFALDMVRAGFIACAPDYLRDGERIHPGDAPYDTTRFYEQFPDWSIHGKDVWDTMRAVDYLQTLGFVDADRIGMVGHSYGGHSTIFAAALEPRIRAAVANGPVSAFREHGMHWAVPKGARSSQSLPALRKYILDPDLDLPVTFAEFTALIAPRPLLVGQAVGERRPLEEQNAAEVAQVYRSLGAGENVRYVWYAGDHDFPPELRAAAVEWFRRWLK